MNMKKRLLSIVSLAAMCLYTTPISSTAEDDVPIALPDWIPTNFQEALEFESTYGTTHIRDGMICLVFKETTNTAYSYDVVPTADAADQYFHEIFEHESDTASFKYEIVLYKPFTSGNFDVALNRTYMENTLVDSSYQFYMDEKGEITETDLYAWIPDCITEYNDFVEHYGKVSIRENHIVYCAEVNYSTGATLMMEQNGTAEIRQILKSGCSTPEVLPVGGGTSYFVEVYQPVSDGTVDVSWKVGREWELEESIVSDIEKTFEISEGGSSITDITNKDIVDDVKGDINADGVFNILDVVLLQKWLLAVPDTHLDNWKAGDFTEDGILNIFDLVLMKKNLIEQNQGVESEVYPVDDPVVIDEFTPCTATIDDNFENWLVCVTIKHQYSVPERIWSVEDFDGVENIKSVLQYKEISPYRQILRISLKNPSKENVLKMIQDIEALNLVEIKEVNTYLYPYLPSPDLL